MAIGTTTQQYIDILEKTNQQLSLWFNPYSLMINVLGILIAVLAVVFAFILWRQGKEYKDNMNAFLETQRRMLNVELKKVRANHKRLLEKQISEVKENLETLRGEAKEKAFLLVKELEHMKQSLDTPALNIIPNNLGGIAYYWSPPGANNLVLGDINSADLMQHNVSEEAGNILFRPLICNKCGTATLTSQNYCSSCGNRTGVL